MSLALTSLYCSTYSLLQPSYTIDITPQLGMISLYFVKHSPYQEKLKFKLGLMRLYLVMRYSFRRMSNFFFLRKSLELDLSYV